MSFNPNIPQITDPLLQSGKQIRANFQAIAQAWAVNHIPLTSDPSNQGMHTVLSMRPLTVDPTTSASQVALYCKAVSSIPQLFYRPNSNQDPIQMTYESINNDGSDRQYSFVAGPFVIYSGYIPNATNGMNVILTPNTNLIYVNLTLTSPKANTKNLVMQVATPINITANSFTISFDGLNTPSTQFGTYYTAVGI